MAIIAECPICKAQRSIRKKICTKCGENLDKAKKANRLKYYIAYRIPHPKDENKQKMIRQLIGTSIKEAQDADSKRKVQKRENRIFDMIPESDITFDDLTKWYLSLNKTRKLKMYEVQKIHLSKFSALFGHLRANQLKLSHLENFQADLLDEEFSNSYIDQIIGSARTTIKKAFDDKMVSGDCFWRDTYSPGYLVYAHAFFMKEVYCLSFVRFYH